MSKEGVPEMRMGRNLQHGRNPEISFFLWSALLSVLDPTSLDFSSYSETVCSALS